MNGVVDRKRCLAAIAWVGIVMAAPVRADQDEALLERAQLPPATRPLLALIVDRSEATAVATAVRQPYDPSIDYGAAVATLMRCDPARIYWRRGAGPLPDCANQAGLAFAPTGRSLGLHCASARSALARNGFYAASRAAQWQPGPSGGYWSMLMADSAAAVECRGDRGQHGSEPGNWYASDGATGPWTNDASIEIDWDQAPRGEPYIFYGGNYLNYARAESPPVSRSMADVMANSMAAALEATDGLDVALIRLDDADGGYVARAPVAAAAAARELQQWARDPPTGGAPLAEALAETAAWLSGSAARFGIDARADSAAFESPASGRYRSPFEHACRPVTLAYLTAGIASNDEEAALAAGNLPGFIERTGGCGADCLPALAQWISEPDMLDAVPGSQSAPLYWLTTAPGTLRADDPSSYVNLVARSLQHDAAVAAGPQLSAPVLLENGDPGGGLEIVYGLTAARLRPRWTGNLLKYGLRAPGSPLAPPTIVDRDGESAIDTATGLPFAASRSLWSDAPDANLLAGGAAGRLPSADGRQIYSELASSRLIDPANGLAPGNPRISRALLALGPGDAESTDDVLAWLRGERALGDPGPHPPAVVEDGRSGRQWLFVATQDGLLHAVDAGSGIEQWAWMPRDLLPRIARMMREEPATVRDHGIDGPLLLHEFDPDGDDRIDATAGEHRWLLFGLGRGGARYYALDLASPDDPRLLWSETLPSDSRVDSSAAPVVARLAIDGSGQSAGHWVVLLSGGYDRQSDFNNAAASGAGNSLRVLDALTGQMLWQAGSDPDADLPLADMTASLPSAPRVLDLDGDGYLDRAYLTDIHGGLWRFEFESGRSARDIASARLLARLGTGAQHFHATPDTSYVARAGRRELAIAVGSGWYTRPRDRGIVDRVYVVFDRDSGSGSPALVESDLFDAADGTATMPATAPGWFRRLEDHGPGEKIIGPTVTFDHLLRFQTYQPLPAGDEQPCGPPQAVQRRYAIDLRTGVPQPAAVELGEDDDERLVSGLPVPLRFGFPERWDGTCEECRARPFGIAGAGLFDVGYAGDPVRTSWRKLGLSPDSR